jgi:formate C-acetyltransferase
MSDKSTLANKSNGKLTYQQRLDAIRATKLEQTLEKQQTIGSMNHDDHGIIPLPPENSEVVQSISGSGMAITDTILKGVEIKSNHENGGFYGAKLCGENFRSILENHPTYIDPMSSLAGGYMVNFGSYRKGGWKPEFDYSHLREVREKYQLIGAIGAVQHFCQDLAIGLELGWQGILDKIKHYRKINTDKSEFYDGLEDVVYGMQNWIKRNAEEAREKAKTEANPQLRENLEQMAEINERLVTQPPQTFREACQWILWYDMAARMYNGSGSLGRLDALLTPYYERDKAAGILTDAEAIFHLACLLARDTAYLQLGGPDENGDDITNRVSFLVLEAAHQLKIPANVGICAGKNVDPNLLRRGVEIMLEDKMGIPKFLGIDNTSEGFAKNGYPLEIARQRAYSGCHWSAIPGKEYAINDCVKINFGVVFDVALRDMMSDNETSASGDKLWQYFEKHMNIAVEGTAKSIDFHLEHMHDVFPEMVLNLLCYGPIENGLDASDAFNGGVEFYNLCIDGCALATVADSFAAIEQRVEKEKRLTWEELMHCLDTNWAGEDGERARLMMKNIKRYGYGGTLADEYARRISNLFTELVKEKPTPNGFNLIPGLFSWANTIPMGKTLGATPNGRYAGDPISHGANPDPGFRPDGAPSAMATAIASVQSGYGNTAPMQIELDPGLSDDEGSLENIISLISTHFDLGGTQINMNVLDKNKILEAHKDPSKYPDLIVRVTGFSAYFSSLSEEFRQLVVDRIIAEN